MGLTDVGRICHSDRTAPFGICSVVSSFVLGVFSGAQIDVATLLGVGVIQTLVASGQNEACSES